jgi:hypothetical protein
MSGVFTRRETMRSIAIALCILGLVGCGGSKPQENKPQRAAKLPPKIEETLKDAGAQVLDWEAADSLIIVTAKLADGEEYLWTFTVQGKSLECAPKKVFEEAKRLTDWSSQPQPPMPGPTGNVVGKTIVPGPMDQ